MQYIHRENVAVCCSLRKDYHNIHVMPQTNNALVAGKGTKKAKLSLYNPLIFYDRFNSKYFTCFQFPEHAAALGRKTAWRAGKKESLYNI